jgi:hydroxyacyl-ACP dehydratase HTD2-like protein with hotdog domain
LVSFIPSMGVSPRIANQPAGLERHMTDEIQSKITDEHRAFIGRKSEPTTVVVKPDDAARIRGILEDADPRWADGTEVAPPYVIAMFQGTPRRGSTPQILPNAILTTQEWRFHRPFRVGETLTAVSQVIDLRDRLGGRYGYSVLVTTSTDFTDAEGTPVAAVLVTVTQFDPAGLQERG